MWVMPPGPEHGACRLISRADEGGTEIQQREPISRRRRGVRRTGLRRAHPVSDVDSPSPRRGAAVASTWSFKCRTCRKTHDGMPWAWGADAPLYYEGIPEAERRARCELTDDACIIDGQHFFIRGLLEIPVIDGPEPFAWIVWCSLSQENFERALAMWTKPGARRSRRTSAGSPRSFRDTRAPLTLRPTSARAKSAAGRSSSSSPPITPLRWSSVKASPRVVSRSLAERLLHQL